MSEYIVEVTGQMPDAIYERELTEIVRCRDCRFCDNDVFAYWCCREKYREFEVDSLDGECMGFCAWAERRTDE